MDGKAEWQHTIVDFSRRFVTQSLGGLVECLADEVILPALQVLICHICAIMDMTLNISLLEAMQRTAISHHITSHHITSHHITSSTSHHITSHHIASHHIKLL